jgi:hypothetical protein
MSSVTWVVASFVCDHRPMVVDDELHRSGHLLFALQAIEQFGADVQPSPLDQLRSPKDDDRRPACAEVRRDRFFGPKGGIGFEVCHHLEMFDVGFFPPAVEESAAVGRAEAVRSPSPAFAARR